MKGKVIRGSHPRGLFNYLLGTDKTQKNIRGRIIGGNMTPPVYPADPAVLTNIFIKSTRARKKPCKKSVLHIPLRMPKGEDVSVETWVAIAKALMIEMGISNNRPWTLIKHPDEHVHLVTSRINYQGDLWHGKWEAFELIKATHKLEKDFKLTVTPTLKDADKDKVRLSSGQIYKNARLQAVGEVAELTPNEKLAELIPAAILQSDGDFKKFERYLTDNEAEVQLSHHKSGEVYGISFKFENAAIKGSKIARAFSWKGITALLETQKAAVHAAQLAAVVVQVSAVDAPSTARLPANPVVEIIPVVPMVLPVSPQKTTDTDAKAGVSKPEVVIIEPPKAPIPGIVQPVSLPKTIQTLQDIAPQLWRNNSNSWPDVKKILIEQLQLDGKLIRDLFNRNRLWFTNKSTLATARLALPTPKMVGVTLLPLVPEILPPTVLVPDQNGLFTTGDVFSDYRRVVVTRNAIEAISYQQLADSGCKDTPPGLIVSADGELPPLWLINQVKNAGRKLFLATKTQASLPQALPQVFVNNEFADWFEFDTSSAPTWHDLLIERARSQANVQSQDILEQ